MLTFSFKPSKHVQIVPLDVYLFFSNWSYWKFKKILWANNESLTNFRSIIRTNKWKTIHIRDARWIHNFQIPPNLDFRTGEVDRSHFIRFGPNLRHDWLQKKKMKQRQKSEFIVETRWEDSVFSLFSLFLESTIGSFILLITVSGYSRLYGELEEGGLRNK